MNLGDELDLASHENSNVTETPQFNFYRIYLDNSIEYRARYKSKYYHFILKNISHPIDKPLNLSLSFVTNSNNKTTFKPTKYDNCYNFHPYPNLQNTAISTNMTKTLETQLFLLLFVISICLHIIVASDANTVQYPLLSMI